jgi:predicted DCC family thiol-disulfide oxidoreductase YuxK
MGQELLKPFNLPADFDQSVVLIENKRIYFKSKAALKITKNLRHGWPILFLLIIIPRVIRDFIYDLIANHRFKWFGKKDNCFIPESNIYNKFLI